MSAAVSMRTLAEKAEKADKTDTLTALDSYITGAQVGLNKTLARALTMSGTPAELVRRRP